ncbi:tripartite tricarboxylate transporter TctB family protein [Azospirillum sp. BE72]|uniref:tripartite tricarboxylate transporter TctB family protein n=1 Tax=Azospirillum sp. BE72 TaxID=2817776 RepID=UPI0028631771|nr:tripartite tricarboxylate transporter TctB family protein [Azospirillum sp. BE72]MDR6772349.1 putative tricarboxylic transport membrane protein [Azospirillum sp. BE72]
MTTGRSLRIGEALLGGGLFALGALIAVETMLTPSAGRGVVGPALFPYLVSAGLMLVALSLLREAFAGHIAHEGGLELDPRAVVLVAAGLAAQFLLIEYLGWIPSAALLFVAVARAFGNRRYLLNAVFGLVLAGGTFAVFNYGLDLNLPIGTVGEWFLPAE